jgi:ribulose-phosphate 3-epimerase
MMCADFINLRAELDLFREYEVDYLHIDVMDGHYVPNLTLGFDFARSLYDYSGITLDFHLMVEKPDQLIPVFSQVEGSLITIHPETSWHPDRTLRSIRDSGCRPGIAIDPAITVEQFRHLYPLIDQVLVMAVNPGYAGQPVIPYALDKIRELHTFLADRSLEKDIAVDGHVSWKLIPEMISAGAGILVAGTSSLFERGTPRKESLERLIDLIGR